MELYNRRLLLFYEDEPSSPDASLRPGLTAIPSSSSSSSPPPPSLFGWPLKLPVPSTLNSNVACIILILLAVLFLLGLIALFVRKFADDYPTTVSSRRRPSFLASSYYNSQTSSCGGLDQTTVESLPVFAYDGKAKHQLDCAICLSEFENGEVVKMIPGCKHVFHSKCIDTWLFSHVTCPICRGTKIFTVGKVEQSDDQDVSDHQEGSAVENGERWREVMGTRGQRRSGSCSSFRDTVVLPRTLSY